MTTTATHTRTMEEVDMAYRALDIDNAQAKYNDNAQAKYSHVMRKGRLYFADGGHGSSGLL